MTISKIINAPKENALVEKINEIIDNKQDALVSGTNIKTINNTSLLGSGNIDIQGGGTVTVDDALSSTSENPVQNKVITDALPDTNQLSYYGTCSTAAATQAKVVVCEGFTLKVGVSIRVKFTNAQSYNGQATLNVNSTGAKGIVTNGTTKAVRYCWFAGEVVSFTYDGTNWVMEDAGIASTTYYGYTKLSSSATSTSTATALTPVGLNNLVQNMIEPYPVYSTSSTYAVGDKVRYSYNVWECITAITTAEAWTADHWIALDPIQTQLDNKQDTITSTNKLSADLLSEGTTNKLVSASEKSTWNGKQNALVSGTNIKTINSTSLLGSGNVAVQPTLVSGTNIKTINGNSLLGSGNITIEAGSDITVDTALSTTSTNPVQNKVITTELNKKIEGISSSDVTTALGYTPYNSSNPSGYQANKIETIKVNGTAQTITSKAVDITVPTNNNQLTNGAGYITSSALTPYALSEDLATVATSGSYNDLSNKPTIPAAQVNADWNATSGKAQILNKPTIPTVPTNVSAFTNDAGYLTEHQSLSSYVPTSRKVAGKALTSDITISASDVGAVPTSRTVNGKALSGNISLTASDVGAISGISSSDVTTALGYTPYNATNPNGYTSNVGTITGIKMNGSSKGTSGVVDLGTVLTAHQDISGKVNVSDIASSVSPNSTNKVPVGAKLFYDTVGNIETALNTINSGSNS